MEKTGNWGQSLAMLRAIPGRSTTRDEILANYMRVELLKKAISDLYPSVKMVTFNTKPDFSTAPLSRISVSAPRTINKPCR
jgi:hypothetical protein